MKLSVIAAAATAVGLVSLASAASAAVTVHTDSFITTPDLFNGFESHVPNGWAPGYLYEEDGIIVHDTGNVQIVNGAFIQADGANSYYINGGGGGIGTYTDINVGIPTLAFNAIQFHVASGGSPRFPGPLNYQLLFQGQVVAQGQAPFGVDSGSLHWLGFSTDALFDEVRLQANNAPALDPTKSNGLVLDSISIGGLQNTGPVPEPAMWVSLITGFGLIGTSLRRRRRADLAA